MQITSRIAWLTAVMIIVLSNGCASSNDPNTPSVVVGGTVLLPGATKPAARITVRILDIRPRSSAFGLAGPQPVAEVKTDEAGIFRAEVPSNVPFEKLMISFIGLPDVAANPQQLRRGLDSVYQITE